MAIGIIWHRLEKVTEISSKVGENPKMTGQGGLAPDTEEAPVGVGVSGRWTELGQADEEVGRVF